MNYLKFFPALFLIFNLSNALASYSEGSDEESEDEEYSSSSSNASAESLTSEDVIIEEEDSEEEKKVKPVPAEESPVEKHEREEREKTELEKARNIAYWGGAIDLSDKLACYIGGKAVLTAVGFSAAFYIAKYDPYGIGGYDPYTSTFHTLGAVLVGGFVDACAATGIAGGLLLYACCDNRHSKGNSQKADDDSQV